MRFLILTIAALCFTGCATPQRPVEVAPALQPGATVQLIDAEGRVTANAPQLQARGAQFNVLALSGGGADGAFGAGLLAGWTASGQRPEFDVVTGISTGALIATYAFLGAEYDERLKAAYTGIRERDVFRDKGLVRGFTSESLLDSKPLAATVANLVDDSILAAVAAAHRAGRRLYVGTTNLDTSELVVWDLGAIAASDAPDRLQLYRDVIVASSAIPGIFTPVYLPNTVDPAAPKTMHVDGGIRAPVLLSSFMVDVPAANRNVFVVVNAYLKRGLPSATIRPTYAAISQRALAELYRGLLQRTLYQTYVLTRNSGANYRLQYIPDALAKTANPVKFEATEMLTLYDGAYALGKQGPQGWQKEPPRLEKFERMPEK